MDVDEGGNNFISHVTTALLTLLCKTSSSSISSWLLRRILAMCCQRYFFLVWMEQLFWCFCAYQLSVLVVPDSGGSCCQTTIILSNSVSVCLPIYVCWRFSPLQSTVQSPDAWPSV